MNPLRSAPGIVFLAFSLFASVALASSETAPFPLEPPLKPDTLTFYIGEARATLNRTLPVSTLPEGSKAIRIALPHNVNKQSVQVSMGGQPVSSITWEARPDWPTPLHEATVTASAGGLNGVKRAEPWNTAPLRHQYLTRTPANENNPERKALLMVIATLETQESLHLGNVTAAESGIAFWQSGSIVAGKGPIDTVPGLANNIEREIPRLQTALVTERAALFEVQRKLARARHDLARFETANISEVALVPVEEDKAQAEITCQYRMPAQTSVRYRIYALPGSNQLEIRQIAELVQASGANWSDVDVSLALINRTGRLNPAIPSPWLLDYKRDLAAKGANSLAYAPVPQVEMVYADSVVPQQRMRPQEPQQEPMATYQLWKLGKRTLNHAENTSIELAHNTFKADYFYTLRPSYSGQGYLTASLLLPKIMEMPAGPADYFIDNDYAGTTMFSLNGNKATIFFGTDPQVTVVTRNLEAKKGELGFLAKDQTRVWHWEYTVRNMRPKPVAIVVEEAQPLSGNESISLKVESTPLPHTVIPDDPAMHEKLKLFVWKKTLASQEDWLIDHKVTAVFTLGKNLDTSR